MLLPTTIRSAILLCAALLLSSCETAYYSAWEQLGIEKRDILVDRVEDARDSQEDAQEQFSSALEEFSTLINFEGGDLERTYNRLSDEYESSLKAANNVSKRIDAIKSVSHALFKEWQDEIQQYENPRLRDESKRQLIETQNRYNDLAQSLERAEASMNPVLANMKDNVLYLKHNLNARAIGALKGEYGTIKRDIDKLIAEMNAAIDRSNQFIASMK